MTNEPSISEDGFFSEPNLLNAHEVMRLIEAVESGLGLGEGRGGMRNLLDLPVFREFAESTNVRAVIDAALGGDAFTVRGILFDKHERANWKVPWHQDVTIAVTNKLDAKGYGPWSIKAGVMHVQPPADVLERMVSVRIHLDDCPAENGPLRVLPGTHRAGKLSQSSINEYVAAMRPTTCAARAGDALIMRPLLLHSSSSAILPMHRRVLHFDYAGVELAEGLRWRERR